MYDLYYGGRKLVEEEAYKIRTANYDGVSIYHNCIRDLDWSDMEYIQNIFGTVLDIEKRKSNNCLIGC
jgi:hypothetical protein